MSTPDQQKLMTWLARCNAVAGSASYQLKGRPELQLQVLVSELNAAAADGVDWRQLYASIYEQWHHRRPLFPDIETMAQKVEHNE